MKVGLRNLEQRQHNGEERFIAAMLRQGLSREEGNRVLALYRKERIVKIDAISGDFKIKHGAFLDADVLRRAAGQSR